MKIMMTNYYLGGVTGSETWTYTVYGELRCRGHDVRLGCVEYTGGLARMLYTAWRLHSKGWSGGEWRPDVIHAHHNVCARRARELWPDVPMVYVEHSTFEPLEQVPEDCKIHRVLCVSGEVMEHVTQKKEWWPVPEMIVGEPIDVRRFRPRAPVNPKIRRVLVVSARLPKRRASIIEDAAHYLGAAIRFIGLNGRVESQASMAQWYNWADVVFSMGRGAYEAMCCGRVPVIFDKWGADGMVTVGNAADLAWYNFSGRKYGRDWSLQELLVCLGKYDAESTRELRAWAVKRCDVGTVCDGLEKVYREAIEYGNPTG